MCMGKHEQLLVDTEIGNTTLYFSYHLRFNFLYQFLCKSVNKGLKMLKELRINKALWNIPK